MHIFYFPSPRLEESERQKLTVPIRMLNYAVVTISKSQMLKQWGYFSFVLHVHCGSGRLHTSKSLRDASCQTTAISNITRQHVEGKRERDKVFARSPWPKQVTWSHWTSSGKRCAIFPCVWKELKSRYRWSTQLSLHLGWCWAHCGHSGNTDDNAMQ